MKRFHEVASVTNNGSLVGFLLCNTETESYLYTDMNEFKNLVHNGEVQYFVLNENGDLDIQYTDEELQQIKQIAKGVDLQSDGIEYYLKNDVKLDLEHVKLKLQHPDICIGFTTVPPVMRFVGPVLILSILDFGNRENELMELARKYKVSASRVPTKGCCPIISFMVPEHCFEKDTERLFDNCLFSLDGLETPSELATSENVKSSI